MEIIKCTQKHILQLQEIAQKTYIHTFAPYNTQENMDAYIQECLNLDKLNSELQNTYSSFFLAVEDEQIIGYLKLNFEPAQTDVHDDTSLEIERIYLSDTVQGKGYGQQLMDFAIQYARSAGKVYVWLGVWEKNETALRFYERNGFHKIGAHDFKLGDDIQTDYLMKRTLD